LVVGLALKTAASPLLIAPETSHSAPDFSAECKLTTPGALMWLNLRQRCRPA